MPRLTARFFGFPQLEVDGVIVKSERRKTLALLVYLAVAGGTYGRETLAALFWPEHNQQQANAYLRRTLWDLHQLLGEGWVETNGQTVSLVISQELWVDVAHFQAKLAQAGKMRGQELPAARPHLSAAVDVYRGDFLAGFTLRDSPAFDEWQQAQAGALRCKFSEALELLVEADRVQANYADAIVHAKRWLALDTLNEAAHRKLMQLYEHAGQRAAALRQYESCAQILKDELAVSPEAATQTLYRQIGAGGLPEGQTAEAPISFKPNFSLPPTHFVGREKELALIAARMADPQCRLLSLVGPGGAGKTRLAMQAALQTADAPQNGFSHGVYLVPLASVNSVDGLVPALAEAVHYSFHSPRGRLPSAEDAQTQLFDYLNCKEALVIVDNMEHLLEGARILTALLGAAPKVKLLVTSRERLNLEGEWVVEIEGLPFPGYREMEPGVEYDAVQLFMQNARRASGNFVATDADCQAIGRICQLVAGLPLGLELAAAWVKTLTCQEIAEEVERNMDFLYATTRGTPERHSSLRAVFEQSWQHLADAEQSVLRQLTVFRGGFRKDAIRPVAGADVEQLAILMDKSLLRRAATGRFELHESLRRYAAEKLESAPQERAAAFERHSRYYLERLFKLGEQLKGPAQITALRSLEAEAENVWQAWEWACQQQQVEPIWRTLPALVLFFEMRSRQMQARAFTQVAISHLCATPAQETASLRALLLAAQWRFDIHQPERSSQVQQESLALVQGLPASYEKAITLLLLCSGQTGVLSMTEAHELARAAADIFRALKDVWGLAMAELVAGDTASFGLHDFEAARAWYQAGWEHFHALGNEWGKILCSTGLAYLAWELRDFNEAQRLSLDSLFVYQKLGDEWRSFEMRGLLTRLSAELNRYADARQYCQENIAYLTKIGDHRLLAGELERLGQLEAAQGRVA